ncbi:uncharacterized protein LOC142662101 [Rhinoderma darwinii]|uniref:uncharacterized protein LOC142662101 n=1 Tax=Rhinoderma darwinii TaxID=43563 RepID=UPI003F66730D
MAATSFKMMNHQKGIFAPKMLKVNHGKYVPTETLVKKPISVTRSEESFKDKDKIIQGNRFNSVEQGEMIKVFVRQRKTTIYKHSVDKWTDLMSNSKDYRKSLALPPSSTEFQNMAKFTSKRGNKSQPPLVRDVGHTVIPQRPDRSSILFRPDGKINCSEAKDLVSNHCSKTKSARTNTWNKEPLLRGIEDIRCQDTGHHGIPFNYSNQRVIGKNNVLRQSDTSDPCKRIKISNVTSVRSMCQKMFQHQMPTVSGALTYSDHATSSTCKTVTNGIKKEQFRSPPPDEIKEGVSFFEGKDRTEASSTYRRRFLLIDSQGLPYTVVVEEPTAIGLSNSTSTSWSDSTLAGDSKPLAPRKVYKCPVCFRIFEYLSYLQRHSIAHSQQKPHVCKVCGKAFKRTSHLTRHKYTHFGGKPCQCQICHRRFRDCGELTRHHQSHTEEKPH